MRGLHAVAALGMFAVLSGPALGQEAVPSAEGYAQAPVDAGRYPQTPGSPVRLAWIAPADCPSEEAVLAEMRRVLGGPPSRGADARAEARQVGPRHWSEHLTTEVDGVAGERTLEADSCEGLVAATGLILAWTIDPQRAAGALLNPSKAQPEAPASRPAPPPQQTAMQSPGPPPAEPMPPAPPPPRSTATAGAAASNHAGLSGVVAGEALGDIGTLPGFDLAGRLSVGALFGRGRLEASFADWLTKKANAPPPQANQGTALHPLEGELRGCLRWWPVRPLELDPCLGGGLTHVTSDGFNEARPNHNGQTTWGTVYGDVFGAWPLLGPLALRASLGFSIPLVRPDFFIAQGNTQISLHRASSIAGRATLGVEVRFP